LNNKQRLYLGYTNAVLMYLTVINLCDEYWSWISIRSFTVSIVVAVILLLGLMFFISSEKKAADYFKTKSGAGAKISRGISSYLLLVGGKFVLMGVIAVLLGDAVDFSGPLHGAIAFIILVSAILGVDSLVRKIYYSLGAPVNS
ncbi:MAG: hypothetical protein GY702_07745, partial [Desulfobulbaceae bacterium]|nr:hypothetical protein [Desulfobulbaceae bacterium]